MIGESMFDPTLAFSVKTPGVCLLTSQILPLQVLVFPQRYRLEAGRMEAFLHPGPPVLPVPVLFPPLL